MNSSDTLQNVEILGTPNHQAIDDMRSAIRRIGLSSGVSAFVLAFSVTMIFTIADSTYDYTGYIFAAGVSTYNCWKASRLTDAWEDLIVREKTGIRTVAVVPEVAQAYESIDTAVRTREVYSMVEALSSLDPDTQRHVGPERIAAVARPH